MSGKLGEVTQTVNDYKSELFSLKTKALAIKQSICNMEDVISSIQASTSVQEEKVDSLKQVRVNSEQFIEDTYRIDGNVADLVNKRKDDFYGQYKYLKPDCEKNGWEKFKDCLKKAGEWCKEHWKEVTTVLLVIAAIVVIVVSLVCTTIAVPVLLLALAKSVLSGVVWGGAIGGIISAITGGSFWEGFKEGAFFGAIGGGIFGGMNFIFTGAVKGAVMKLWKTLVTGGVSGIGSILFGDLGDIVFKGEAMSWKKIVTDVIVAGVTGVAFAGIGYGLSKAFSALKLKIINKGGSTAVNQAKSWQGSGRYPGVDDWKPKTYQEGEIIYRGEPNGSEFFTTREAIDSVGANKNLLFEGLQVEPHPTLGYRPEMQGYQFKSGIEGAEAPCLANPDYGAGGLIQEFVPDANTLIENGILAPVDKIKLQ